MENKKYRYGYIVTQPLHKMQPKVNFKVELSFPFPSPVALPRLKSLVYPTI